jgi:hypothetical protein
MPLLVSPSQSDLRCLTWYIAMDTQNGGARSDAGRLASLWTIFLVCDAMQVGLILRAFALATLCVPSVACGL